MEEHDCSKHDNRKRFDFILKKFLSEKVESDQGSWAPVTPETKGQLDELIHLLILLKWEEDCDGDLPVRYKVWDRTKDMQDSYSQFVVPKEPQNTQEFLRWIRLIAVNAKMAVETLNREIDCLEFRKITFEPGYKDE
jgi:hypothetical protein